MILKLQAEKSEEVESLLEAMREDREELDQVWAASQYFIRNHNIIEVVQRREEKLKELTNYLTRPLVPWNPVVLSLKETGMLSFNSSQCSPFIKTLGPDMLACDNEFLKKKNPF